MKSPSGPTTSPGSGSAVARDFDHRRRAGAAKASISILSRARSSRTAHASMGGVTLNAAFEDTVYSPRARRVPVDPLARSAVRRALPTPVPLTTPYRPTPRRQQRYQRPRSQFRALLPEPIPVRPLIRRTRSRRPNPRRSRARRPNLIHLHRRHRPRDVHEPAVPETTDAIAHLQGVPDS